MDIINRLSLDGSPTKLALYRILIGALVLWICISEMSSMVDYVNYIGVSHSAMRTITPNIVDEFTQNYLGEIRYLLCACSVLYILGIFYRYVSVLFFCLLFLYYNGLTSSIMLHGQWPYLWFIAFVMMFARASDVLSVDYFLFYKKSISTVSKKAYRWPIELSILWIVILYGWAGIAKILPLNNVLVWLEGNTVKSLVYERFLISPAYYLFGRPLFNYARGYDFIFVLLAITTIVVELSAFMFLFTKKYAYHFIIIVGLFHIGITLIGVGDFFLVFIVTSFCLWNEELFRGLDKKLAIPKRID